jgi:Copper fist DNA binding domain
MVDGQRYTCEKCRKGHRTGTCTHLVDDNGNPSLLQKTNRAGRPNTTSKCRCPSSDRCTCVKTWYLVVRIPKSEIEPGKEGENNCRIVATVVKPLREDSTDKKDSKHGGTLIATSKGSSGHQCNCGDACSCTYCPEHPDNQATHDHNQYLANQNRPTDSIPQPDQHLIESSSQGCAGTAEVTYACTSDTSAAAQEAMLSTIPLNDQNYHYQVYSGQYSRGGCGSSCRCPGCITWRVDPIVKQQLLLSGYGHEDCPPKCNCRGCWSHRERGSVVESPIHSLDEFFSPLQDTLQGFDPLSPPVAPNTNLAYGNGSLASEHLSAPYSTLHLENLLPIRSQATHLTSSDGLGNQLLDPYLASNANQSYQYQTEVAPLGVFSPFLPSAPAYVSQSTTEPYR